MNENVNAELSGIAVQLQYPRNCVYYALGNLIKHTNFRSIWPKKRIEVLQNLIKFEKERKDRNAKVKRKLGMVAAQVDIQVDKCSRRRRSA